MGASISCVTDSAPRHQTIYLLQLLSADDQSHSNYLLSVKQGADASTAGREKSECLPRILASCQIKLGRNLWGWGNERVCFHVCACSLSVGTGERCVNSGVFLLMCECGGVHCVSVEGSTV